MSDEQIRKDSAVDRFEAFTNDGMKKFTSTLKEYQTVIHDFRSLVYGSSQNLTLLREEALKNIRAGSQEAVAGMIQDLETASQKTIQSFKEVEQHMQGYFSRERRRLIFMLGILGIISSLTSIGSVYWALHLFKAKTVVIMSKNTYK